MSETPEWLVRVAEEARELLDSLPSAQQPSWYRWVRSDV